MSVLVLLWKQTHKVPLEGGWLNGKQTQPALKAMGEDQDPRFHFALLRNLVPEEDIKGTVQ
jgi:hypothetical protein